MEGRVLLNADHPAECDAKLKDDEGNRAATSNSTDAGVKRLH